MEITFGWCGGEISDQLEADEEEKRREGGRGLLGRRVQLTQSPLSLSLSLSLSLFDLSLNLFSENNWKKRSKSQTLIQYDLTVQRVIRAKPIENKGEDR